MATIDGQGLISNGSRLEVMIGDAEQHAKRALERQGIIMAGTKRGGTCLTPARFQADYTTQFLDSS